MKAADRWRELGVDARELAALKFGIVDPPDYPVSPFSLPKIRLNQEDSMVMQDLVKKETEENNWD